MGAAGTASICSTCGQRRPGGRGTTPVRAMRPGGSAPVGCPWFRSDAAASLQWETTSTSRCASSPAELVSARDRDPAATLVAARAVATGSQRPPQHVRLQPVANARCCASLRAHPSTPAAELRRPSRRRRGRDPSGIEEHARRRETAGRPATEDDPPAGGADEIPQGSRSTHGTGRPQVAQRPRTTLPPEARTRSLRDRGARTAPGDRRSPSDRGRPSRRRRGRDPQGSRSTHGAGRPQVAQRPRTTLPPEARTRPSGIEEHARRRETAGRPATEDDPGSDPQPSASWTARVRRSWSWRLASRSVRTWTRWMPPARRVRVRTVGRSLARSIRW